MYHRLGFRRRKTLYKAVEASGASCPRVDSRPAVSGGFVGH
jgi:hypothetical protein